MKPPRFSEMLSASLLFACLSLVAFCPQEAAAQQAAAQPPIFGATYIITNTDAAGPFSSRGVITLNVDHTLSVIDSGQGASFSSQLGTWGVGSKGTLVGRTIDFDYPSGAFQGDVARLDYTFQFGSNGSISGTISLYIFTPLATANPLMEEAR
jgi:hypothetical protein